jgi:hypothetical protein
MTEQEATDLALRIPLKEGGGVRAVGIGSAGWPPEVGGTDYYAYAELWSKQGRVVLHTEQQLAQLVASLNDPAAPENRRPGRSPRPSREH